jgi:probable rRNA maturation factor
MIKAQHMAIDVALKNYAISDWSALVLQNERCLHYHINFNHATSLHMQKLNHQYRQELKPTNVLSFTYHASPMLIAEVVFCLDIIQSEAINYDVPFVDHLAHLCIHGVLHVLGYDHISNAEFTVMKNKEIFYLSQFNIKNPYANQKQLHG